jgi:DNA polymerase-3 subunit alpha
MVKAGVFDSIDKNRGRLFKNADTVLRYAASEAEARESSQMSLLGGSNAPPLKLENGPDWSPHEKLNQEFEAVGFYLSAHPLDAYSKSLKRLGVLKVAELPRHLSSGGKGRVKLAGSLLAKQERTSAKGSRYAFLTLSDATGMFEVTCFSEVLASSRELLEQGGPLLLDVDAKLEDEQLRLTCQRISSLEHEAARAAAGLRITIRDDSPIRTLAGLIEKEPKGRNRITIIAQMDKREVELGIGRPIALSAGLMGAVRSVAGVVEVEEV